jgi:chromosome partitioning protein
LTKIISILNQKGGVGKTTISQHLIVGLRKKGYRVLAVDFDAQCDLTFIFNIENTYTIYDVIQNNANVNECIENDFLAGSRYLNNIDFNKQKHKDFLLKNALKNIIYNYDYIIIDTPPALSDITVNALTASDEILIIAQGDILSIKGISQLGESISVIKTYTNKNLAIKGILLTRFANRTVLAKDVAEKLEELASGLNTKLFKIKIRECNAIKEAQANQTNIYDYKKNSIAYNDFKNFIEEFLEEKDGENNE